MRIIHKALWTAAGLVGLAALLAAAPAAADIVHLDDVIIDGSLCVGFDCVNGESFGFDTIRLKENNTRIHFLDTSNSASFPRNDWQLTANDSSNGGAEKFSIDDLSNARIPFTLTAGAPNHSLFVNSSGRIGLKTNTPVVELHIKDGDTPTVRLEQDGSSGFTPQTWDMAGNETNYFVRDVTNGSTLPFRIRPGAPSSMIDIAASTRVGINNTAPGSTLHVRKSGASVTPTENTAMVVQNNGAGTDPATIFLVGADNSQLAFANSAATAQGRVAYRFSDNALRFFANGSERAQFNSSGQLCLSSDASSFVCNADLEIRTSGGANFSEINAGATTFTASSSRAVKENLREVDVPDILDKIARVGVYNYDFITGQKDRVGLMAEDFHQIFQRGSDKMLSGDEVQMALWLAVQELIAHNQQLQERLATVEARTQQ